MKAGEGMTWLDGITDSVDMSLSMRVRRESPLGDSGG